MIEIENPELKELDKRIAEFYKLSFNYMCALGNLYGRRVYKSELSQILKQAEKIKPESKFDKLLLKNILSNLRLNDLTMDYVSDLDFSLTVQEFFDKIAGQGAWDNLEERVRNPPWKKRWEHSKMTQERDFARVSSFTDEAQKAARKWIPKIKNDVLMYGKSEGYLPEDFDMSILLLPPKEGRETSDWNSVNHILSLGSYGFEFFHKKEGIIAVPTRAYSIVFHEVLGHGAHQIHSADLPLSVRFTQEIGGITSTKPVTEGIAKNNESQVCNFLKTKLKELDLTKEDLKILELENELRQQSLYENMYFCLTKDRELREKGFDGYKYLLKLTNNPVSATTFKHDFKSRFAHSWETIGHLLGDFHYKNMEKRVNQEFGKEYLAKEKKKFHRASLRGVWSWEVYPEAVCYFLRK